MIATRWSKAGLLCAGKTAWQTKSSERRPGCKDQRSSRLCPGGDSRSQALPPGELLRILFAKTHNRLYTDISVRSFAQRFPDKSMEGWLSPVEGTRLEIERRVKPTVGSNPTPSANSRSESNRYPWSNRAKCLRQARALHQTMGMRIIVDVDG